MQLLEHLSIMKENTGGAGHGFMRGPILKQLKTGVVLMMLCFCFFSPATASIKQLKIGGRPIDKFIVIAPSARLETSFRPFVDGKADNSIGVALGKEFVSLMQQFCGVTLPLAENSPREAHVHDKYIYFKFDADLHPDGFRISVNKGHVTIEGGTSNGLWYGMFDFLEHFLGVRFPSRYDPIYCPSRDEVNVADTSYSEKPVFEFRDINSYYTANVGDVSPFDNLAHRINSRTGSKHYMNPFKFGSGPGTMLWNAHSFGGDQGQIPVGVKGHDEGEQPCLSKKETHDYVVRSILEQVRKRLEAGRIIGVNLSWVTVGWNDNTNYCMCPDCVKARSGGRNLSDQYIAFVNGVADEVRKVYPSLKIYALAYDNTRIPPRREVPRDNVVVMYCGGGDNHHSHADTRSCDEPGNALPDKYINTRSDEINLEGWLQITPNVYFWAYYDCFGARIAGSPFLRYVYEDLGHLARIGVKGIYAEGREAGGDSCQFVFEKLRDYLVSKLLWNPRMSYNDYLSLAKEFISIYYGQAAAEPIWRYLLLWEEAANRSGDDFVYNFDGIKAIFNLEYFAGHEAEMRALFDEAEKAQVSETQHLRILKLRQSMQFLRLSALYYERYVNAPEDTRKNYVAEVKKLFLDMVKYHLTDLDGIPDDDLSRGVFDENSAAQTIDGKHNFARYHATESSPAGFCLDFCPMAYYWAREGFWDLAPRYYAVQFHSNGGTPVCGQTIYNYYVREPASTRRSGYTFEGWFTDPECSGPRFFFGYRYGRENMVDENDCDDHGVFHLYAKWKSRQSDVEPASQAVFVKAKKTVTP